MPTNKKLINGEGSEEERAELAKKWGRLHWYRTAAGVASFAAMALALARLKHK
jgi:hypothetical protein